MSWVCMVCGNINESGNKCTQCGYQRDAFDLKIANAVLALRAGDITWFQYFEIVRGAL